MKRFSLIVSLTACLVLAFGVSAFAAWDITIESKTVAQNATGVTVGYEISFEMGMSAIVVPCVVREVDAGSFWTGSLPYDTTGNAPNGVAWHASVPGWAVIAKEVRPGVPTSPCATDGDVGYDGTTPDHFAVSTTGVVGLPAEPTGMTFVTLTMDVTGAVGDFEIDVACFSSSLNGIFMVDSDFPPTDWASQTTFNKGVITIKANDCPSNSGSYADPLNGVWNSPMSNAWDGSAYTDTETDDPRFYLIAPSPGAVDLLTGMWTWTPIPGDEGPYTVQIEVGDAAHSEGDCLAPGPASVIGFSGSIASIPIGLVCPPDRDVHWSATTAGQATVTTPITVVYANTGGPATTFDVNTGAWSWDAVCANLGVPQAVDISASHGIYSENCSFNVTVTNDPPVCAVVNPTPFLYTLGYSHDLNLEISDPNGDGLTISNLQHDPVSGAQPVLAGGVVTWNPIDAANAPGTINFSVDVTDGCETVTCNWSIDLLFAEAYKISILDPVDMDHQVRSLNGRNATIGVHMTKGFTQGTGAFDFLLCYDCSALSFISGEKGAGIADWEYFTYRYGPFGNNCGSGCPSCYIRLLGIRDMNNGVTAPAGSEFVDGFIAMLTFYVSEDRSLIGMCPRIGFCSIDCGDNIISDVSGNEIAIAMPGQFGPDTLIIFGPDYDLNDCIISTKGIPANSYIWFDPGYICIVPPIDDRGDINLNGLANEIGDAVLLTNYFIYGSSVLLGVPPDGYYENRVLATDINDDGIVLTVADLVYLIRIITGDAQPFPESGEGGYKLNPYSTALDVNTEMIDGKLVVSTNSTSELGAASLIFRYTNVDLGTPETNTGMTVKSNAANGEFRVLVYSMEGNRINAGNSILLTIPVSGAGSIELVESSISDAQGSVMAVTTVAKAVPTAFELMQNYPNPFNASTNIRFALPEASDWTLNIYNVAGQVVKTTSGSSAAGYVSYNWNAETASGIYFYKVSAGNFEQTKKMVLMK